MGAYGVLVIGDSGRGKTYSMKNLPPEQTVIINCESKQFTFKGGRRFGNVFNVYNYAEIRAIFENAAADESIKYIVVDDMQYQILNSYSDRAFEKGFEKYAEIGVGAHQILGLKRYMRDDQFVIFLNHEETNELGEIGVKIPAGRFVKEKVVPEGMFTVVLRAIKKDGKFLFSTENTGRDVVKAPEEMFVEPFIPNDLKLVTDTIYAYEMDLEAPAIQTIAENKSDQVLPDTTKQPEPKKEVEVPAGGNGGLLGGEPKEEIVQPETKPEPVEDTPSEPVQNDEPKAEETPQRDYSGLGGSDRETMISNICAGFGSKEKAEAFLRTQGILEDGMLMDVLSDEHLKQFNENLETIVASLG